MRSIKPPPGLERFYAQLDLKNLRKSAARDLIFHAVRDFGPITKKQLADQLASKVASASVYRNCRVLLDAEVIQYVLRDQLELTDRFKQHHHFFSCRHCGAKIPFNDAAVEQSIMRLHQKTQFALEEHVIELSGLCRACITNGVSHHMPIGTNLRRPPGH